MAKITGPVTETTKPSQLIHLALKDLTKVEKSKKYVVNMARWHLPQTKWLKNGPVPTGKCEVCLAGAVMAKSLNSPADENFGPSDFGRVLSGKLQSLNMFRTGYVREGVEAFFGYGTKKAEKAEAKCSVVFPQKPSWTHPEVTVVKYSKRASEKFKRELRAIASKLESVGL